VPATSPAGWSGALIAIPAIVTDWLDDWEAPRRTARSATRGRCSVIDRAARRARPPDRVGLDRLAARRCVMPTRPGFRAALADEAGWEPVQTLDDQAA
jgi:hypothetical protein